MWEVVEAKPWDVGAVIHRLRPSHMEALERVGINRRAAHRELRRNFDMSSFRKTWKRDGRVLAVGGVTGDLLTDQGYIWLALTGEAVGFPVQMLKEARRQLGKIM